MHITSTQSVRRSIVVAAAVAVTALAACGSDDPGTAAGGDVESGEIEIRAIDYAYLDVPERIRSGSQLTLTNASADEAHELVAIRLPDDETRSAAELVQLPPGELGAFLPEVRTVVLAAPEATGVPVVGDGTLTEPGRYLLVCVIPTGADPEEYLELAATSDGPPQVDGGPPHIAEGMFGELEVIG